MFFIGGACGGGKGSPLSTPVYTPWGAKKIGDLKNGDVISAPDGSPQKVIGIKDKQKQDVFTVFFDDGSRLETDSDHLWLVHKTRAHKSKSTGNFNLSGFPNSLLMNTVEIKNFLNEKNNAEEDKFIKKQHLIIPLCDPIGFNSKYNHKIPPYILGALLGDGCMSQKNGMITFTNIDAEIIERFELEGYSLDKVQSTKYGYNLKKKTKIKEDLDELSLLGTKSDTKFIPESYKYSSIQKRYDLVQGLMDTDGYVCSRGHMSYTSVSKKLAEDFQWVVRSLGCKAKIVKKKSGYKDSDGNYIKCKDSYTIYFKPSNSPQRFVNLSRKKERCKEFNNGVSVVGRRIVSVEKTSYEKTRCISVSHPSRLYVTNDFIVTHNSEILTALPGRYLDCPLFTGTMVRSTVSQLMKPGNLWTKANNMYKRLPENYRPRFFKGDRKVARFPHGPEIEYTYMKSDGDEENFQGAEYTFIGLDEALQMQFWQIVYLFSRLRSPSKYTSRLIMSGNPSPDHEIADMISWYLDDEGYPHPEKEGLIRYFITQGGDFVWSNNKEDLIENYKTEYYTPQPLSFSFLSSTIYDNPICMQQNPQYVSFLEGLPPVEKARLLYGNWFARPEGANYFKRENLQKINTAPLDCTWVRAWDKASAIPTDVEKFPDRSACIKMGKNQNGEYFIAMFPHPDNRDDWETERYGSFRAKPGKRDNIIRKQAEYDGDDVNIILPIDPGAAGQSEFQESAKKLAQHGFIVKKDPSVSNKSKLTKFSPFAAAVENGLVYIIESSFPNKQTLEAFYKELEAFDGERSTRKRKDDWVDAVSTAYNYLSKSIVIPKFTLPNSGINNNIRKLKSQVTA